MIPQLVLAICSGRAFFDLLYIYKCFCLNRIAVGSGPLFHYFTSFFVSLTNSPHVKICLVTLILSHQEFFVNRTGHASAQTVAVWVFNFLVYSIFDGLTVTL